MLPRLLLLLMMLAGLLAGGAAAGGDGHDRATVTHEVPWNWGVRPWVLLGVEGREALRLELEDNAFEAWTRVREQGGDRWWPGTLYIHWVEDEREFRAHTGHRAEHTAAAAAGARRIIWINASAWRRSNHRENIQTLAHEMGHVLLAHLPGSANRALPLWAEEGIVMHLAGQGGAAEHLALARHRLAGTLPDLGTLEREFPAGGEARAVAYALSHYAVAQAARAHGDRRGEVSRLIATLAHPERGPALARDFHDPFRREGWDLAVRESLGSDLTLGLIVFSSGTMLWLLVLVVAALAWLRLRAKKAAFERREREEEPWAESLTEADVQDIYGDREDRWEADEEPPQAPAPPARPARRVPWPEAEDR